MATKLQSAIDTMLKKYKIEKPVRQGEALFIWNEVVGETIAKHTKPEKVAWGKLFIKVDSASWRNELVFKKESILNKINNKLKNVTIKEIILR